MKQTVPPLILLVALLCSGCAKDLYIVTTNVSPSEAGTVTGGGMYEKGTTATLAVTPANGYTFIAWSDGNTDNPRTVTVTADADYTAQCIVTPNGGGNQNENYDNIVIWGLKNNGSYDTAWVPYTDLGNYRGLRMYEGMLAGYMFSSSNDNYPPTDDAVSLSVDVYGTGGYIHHADNTGWMEYARLEYYSSFDNHIWDSSDYYYYGNWRGKELTVTINAIDLTACTASLNINATMYDAYKFFINEVPVSGCPTKILYIKLKDIKFYQLR